MAKLTFALPLTVCVFVPCRRLQWLIVMSYIGHLHRSDKVGHLTIA